MRSNGFLTIENEMNRVSQNLFAPAAAARTTTTTTRNWAPAVDIVETPEAIELVADLPGLQASDLDVKVENGVLTIRGERKDERADKGAAYHLYERRYGAFVRSFELPELVDAAAVKAKYTDG